MTREKGRIRQLRPVNQRRQRLETKCLARAEAWEDSRLRTQHRRSGPWGREGSLGRLPGFGPESLFTC